MIPPVLDKPERGGGGSEAEAQPYNFLKSEGEFLEYDSTALQDTGKQPECIKV